MSIRTRLLVLVALATLVPGILVGIRFLQDRAAAVAAATTSLAEAARTIGDDIEEKVQGTAQLLYGLARARDLDTRDRAVCSRFLNAVREEYPQYTGILTIDPDGRLFCDSLTTGRELDLNDRGYFKKAQTTRDGVILEPAVGRLTGLSVLQIARPTQDDAGALKFVLLASLNLNKLVDDHRKRGMRGDILLVDGAGTVMVWSRGGDRPPIPAPQPGNATPAQTQIAAERPAVLQLASDRQRPLVAEIRDTSGDAEVWAVAAQPTKHDSGIRVLVGLRKADLTAIANQRLVQDLVLLALISGLLFASVWMLAEISLRRQVSRIAAMATRLGQGDLAARIAAPHPRGELGALMGLMNGAAESLEKQRAAIEDLDRKLRQSQKMEAIGQLTGGVAHDFNNLLTVILGNAEMLSESLGDNRKLRSLADMTAMAAERGAELTSRLLVFSRRQPLDPKPSDFNRQIAAMDGLLRRTLGENTEIEMVRGGGLWKAMVDPGQLESAILNLCINARDAMPKGGRLTIETANASFDAEAARRNEVEPGQYVMVAVSDTGSGMDAATVERAFEPFFTTKGVGKGSGLGLSMVYGFVKQSKGHVRIYSEVGQGTAVKLYLPRADAEPAAEGTPASEAPLTGGREKVLLVEDDDMVRENAAAMLSGLGYTVVMARNGPEALALIERNADFDLLFTDVVMPGGMNGRELAEAALKLRPGLPVLFTSGYTENAIVHHGRLDRGVHLLAKPYRRQDLATKLRDVLRKSG